MDSENHPNEEDTLEVKPNTEQQSSGNLEQARRNGIFIRLKLLDKDSPNGTDSVDEVYSVSSLDEDVSTLRQQISEKHEVDCGKIRLMFQGKLLKDGDTFNSYRISADKVLHGVITRDTNVSTANSTSQARSENRTQPNANNDAASFMNAFASLLGNTNNDANIQMSVIDQNGQVMATTSDGNQIPNFPTNNLRPTRTMLPGQNQVIGNSGRNVSRPTRNFRTSGSIASLIEMMVNSDRNNAPDGDSSSRVPRPSNGLLALGSLKKEFRLKPYDRGTKKLNEEHVVPIGFAFPGFKNSCRFGLFSSQMRICPDRIVMLEALGSLNFLMRVSNDLSTEMLLDSQEANPAGVQIAAEIFALCRLSHKLPDLFMGLSLSYGLLDSGNCPLSTMSGAYYEAVGAVLNQFSVVCRLLVDRLKGLGVDVPRSIGGTHIDEITSEPYHTLYSLPSNTSTQETTPANSAIISTD